VKPLVGLDSLAICLVRPLYCWLAFVLRRQRILAFEKNLRGAMGAINLVVLVKKED
jgi:hypothetical protein